MARKPECATLDKDNW